jgi:O-antigen ligase
MNLSNIFLILIILVPVLYYLIHDYMKGLCISVFLLVFLSPYLLIETPGSFPNFTIHRLILILLFIVWLIKGSTNKQIGRIPFFKLFLFLLITNLISVMLSVDFVSSLKQYLSYVIELLLYYLIILKSIEKRNDVLRLLKYICFGLALVAFFALIEKYTGFNPVSQFVHGYIRLENVGHVISTYPHRILLGTAMAMAFPIGLALIDEAKENKFKRITAWCLTALFLSSCYFAMSRGPWIAIILAVLIIFCLGSSSLRKKALIIVMVGILTLILKPGVWKTLESQAEATMDEKTMKGANYQYRWELWRIAYTEIRKSPVRTLWGYGQGGSKAMDIKANVSIYRDEAAILSWDNHYAWYLVATGFLGLTAVILLYGSIAKRMFMLRRNVVESDQDIMTSIISSIMVLLFMMSNVYIFAPQLNYLFWTLVAMGITLGQNSRSYLDK